MNRVHASVTESGGIDVGGSHLLFALTSWGDGIFPVYADYDGAGGLVAVRLALGDEKHVQRFTDMLDLD
jgi:hypothetical protein